MSINSLFQSLEDARDFWLWVGILILIWIWSMVFDTPIFQILASYHFEGEKNIHVFEILGWAFGVCWRFLNEVWYINLDLNMVTGLWYTYALYFGSLSWVWKFKEYLCPDLGLLRMLEVPDWGLASWSWHSYGFWSLIHPCSEFWLSIVILKVQRTSMSLKSWFKALKAGCWMFLTGVWYLDLDMNMVIGLWYTHVPNFGSILVLKVQEHQCPLKPDLGLSKMGSGILILTWIWSLVFNKPMF